MGNFTPASISLKKLLQDVDCGKLKLPCFQRDYKWTAPKVKKLIDSIQNDHPAGSLLFLAVDYNKIIIKEDNFKFTQEENLTEKIEYLVLDGQQRLTSCYCAFYNKGLKSYYLKYIELMKLDKCSKSEEIDFEQLIVDKRHTDFPDSFLDEGLLPLSFIKDNKTLREKLKPYKDSIKNNPEKTEIYDFLDEKLGNYLDTIFEYEFPVIILPKDLSLDAVCKVFQTINSTGLKLSAFDICVAKFMRYHIKLKELVDKAKRINHNIEIVLDNEETLVLQTIALLANKNIKKNQLADTLEKLDIDNYWNKAINGLSLTVDILDDFGVGCKKDLSLLPYKPIFPLFASVLISTDYANQHITKQSNIREKLRKFFFCTALSSRYTEGTDNKTKDDYLALQNWIQFDVEPKIISIGVLWNTEKYIAATKQGAFGKAVLCILNKQPITDFYVTDLKVGVGIEKEASQLHHIFPDATYGDEFKDSINSVFNFTFLTSAANNFIDAKKTKIYLDDIVKNSGKDLEGLKSLLKNHLITGETFDYLYNGAYLSFIKSRANEVKKVLSSMGIVINDVDKNEIDSQIDDEDLVNAEE